ncbi:MAG: hypothetical protein HYY03_03580 [Chloroflexi bacterium]|nr:hypothetical protein [Chloroflexota bacterium]
MPIAPGSLHCLSGWSAKRRLGPLIEEAVRAHVDPDEVHHLYGDVLLVYSDAGTAAIRDWLIPSLEEGESVFVVEFEKWSGYGPAPDREWLGRRGH